MPREITMGARTELGVLEYEAFVKWYRSVYGADAPTPPNNASIFNIPAYTMFVQGGRPGFVSIDKLGPEERRIETGRWTPPPTPEEPGLEYPEEPMSEYQREQLALAREEMQLKYGQGAQEGGTPYDEYKRRFLSELTGPVDWITRSMAMQTPTPSRATQPKPWSAMSPGERGGMMAQGTWGPVTGPMLRGGYGGAQFADPSLGGDLAQYREALAEARRGAVSGIGGTPPKGGFKEIRGGLPTGPHPVGAPIGGEEEGPATPTLPIPPDWLLQYVPGLEKGKPITARQVPTPSAQQWAKMPWSQREMLRGYVSWAGPHAGTRPMQDIQEHMAMMLPEEPRGVRSKRWMPARQRA